MTTTLPRRAAGSASRHSRRWTRACDSKSRSGKRSTCRRRDCHACSDKFITGWRKRTSQRLRRSGRGPEAEATFPECLLPCATSTAVLLITTGAKYTRLGSRIQLREPDGGVKWGMWLASGWISSFRDQLREEWASAMLTQALGALAAAHRRPAPARPRDRPEETAKRRRVSPQQTPEKPPVALRSRRYRQRHPVAGARRESGGGVSWGMSLA